MAKIKIPKPGDKIQITDYSGMEPNEAARISKLPYLTVESVLPIPLTDERGERYTAYEVYANETDYLIGINWKFYGE